jgi:hypothetical protein
MEDYWTLFEKNDYEHDGISYDEKLKTIQWHNKRNEVIKRDNHTCTECKKSPCTDLTLFKSMTIEEERSYIKEQQIEFEKSELGQKYLDIFGKFPNFGIPMIPIDSSMNLAFITLQVHHKYYVKNKLPWEYENEALVTLCSECHQKTHDENTIPYYDSLDKEYQLFLTACDRCNGSGNIPKFSHIEHGICFKCYGNRYSEFK